jgi:hypothetical protein
MLAEADLEQISVSGPSGRFARTHTSLSSRARPDVSNIDHLELFAIA